MIGTTLSHYEINAELGRGGMGIVYKARDTKLDREVAIKVLPSAALASSDDRERFYREAKSAAALNHPNIAQVYQIDEAVPSDAPHGTQPSPFIAMEYIDGETLDARIKRGPLKLGEAVRLATQIAGALGAAHEKGIVHRDVKASNVMLTSKGEAKVLDFGLALTAASTKLTRMGSTLGTVAYMSPEQARGEEVDRRTDLWALGVVLYEMVAGRNPFGGDYEQAVVYSILNAEPEPLTAVRTGVPMELERITNKLLAKDADYRYQSAAGLLVDLKSLDLSGSGQSRMSTVVMDVPTAQDPAPRSSLAKTAAIAAGMLLTGLVVGWMAFNRSPEPEPLRRVSINLPGMNNVRFLSMSPRGDYMAFVAQDEDGRQGIFLRDMATAQIRYVEGSSGAGSRDLGFSPDGSRLAFSEGLNNGILTFVVPAGLPERQTDRGRLYFWDSDESFIYADEPNGSGPIRKTIGIANPDTIRLDEGELPGDYQNVWKARIPGTDIVFGHQMVAGPLAQTATSSLVRTRLNEGGDVDVLESPIMNPAWVEGGFLVYNQRNDAGALVVRPVDARTGALTGPPVDALPPGEQTFWGRNTVTPDGDLMYIRSGLGIQNGDRKVYEVNPNDGVARALQFTLPADAIIRDVTVSPEGDLLALAVDVGRISNIHVYDRTSRVTTQITFEERARRPVWSPDGEWIYYAGFGARSPQINRIRPSASSARDSILFGSVPFDISADGNLLAVSRPGPSYRNLWLLNLRTSELTPVDTSDANVNDASFSPDSEFLAYVLAGASPTVVVSSVDGSRKTRMSDRPQVSPRWSPDGSHLYTSNIATMRYPVRTAPSFSQMGEPEVLFFGAQLFPNGFDVFPDGRTFAIVTTDIQFDEVSESTSTEIIWLQNWSNYLKQEYDR